jgi:hypothetical protein
LINHVTLRIKVKKIPNEFGGLMHARVKKLNPHANTPTAVKMNEIKKKNIPENDKQKVLFLASVLNNIRCN